MRQDEGRNPGRQTPGWMFSNKTAQKIATEQGKECSSNCYILNPDNEFRHPREHRSYHKE